MNKIVSESNIHNLHNGILFQQYKIPNPQGLPETANEIFQLTNSSARVRENQDSPFANVNVPVVPFTP